MIDKFINLFRNGKEKKINIDTESKIINKDPWELNEDVDTAILSEIESDYHGVIESFQNLKVNLLILNEDFRIVFISDVLLKIIEYKKEELIGKLFSVLVSDPISEIEKRDLKSEIGAISIFKKLIVKSGENIFSQLYIQAVKGSGILCYTVIILPSGDKKSF